MKNFTSTLCTALLLIASPVVAQDGDASGTLGTGRTVTGKAQGQVAKRAMGPQLVKAPIGSAAKVQTADGIALGTFEDHVIDLSTGAVVFVVVKTADASRLVPYSRFSWDAETRALSLAATPEDLAGMPEYDAKKLQSLDGFGRVADAAEAGTQEASAKSDEILRNVTASQLLGASVFVEKSSFASTSGLVLDPTIGRIGFVLVHDAPARNASPMIVPWRALDWTQEKADDNGHFRLGMTKAQLIDAPRLEGGDPKTLADRDAVKTIRSFYREVAPKRGGAAVRTKGARD